MDRKRRILLVAEPLRLSNAARLATLGRALHEAGYTIVLAADPASSALIGPVPFRTIPLHPAFTREERKARWRAMLPMFDVPTLERYVREDARLIRLVAPDLVIGDMRPSLPISARKLRVRFAVIADAVFSPYCTLPFELPNLPLMQEIGRGRAQNLADMLVPAGMFLHAIPGNLVRMGNGVDRWHSDVRETYTDADLVIYPNIPEIVPVKDIPPSHRFVGPVLWPSTDPDPRPPWWGQLPTDRPVVWVNLSTADPMSFADAVLDGLVDIRATVVVSAAADDPVVAGREGVFAADNIRNTQMEKLADLVITNADTTSIQQSLASGTPVLVVPEREESVGYAHAVRALGAAEVLHGDEDTMGDVHVMATRMLAEPSFGKAANALAAMMAKYDSGNAVVAFVNQVFEVSPPDLVSA